MSRQLKFRGKRVDNGEWVYGDYGRFHKRDGDWTHEIHCPIPKISGSFWNEVTPETVGQFTGLHDKNGVEIYEGDKIKAITHGYTGEVEYETEQAAFMICWTDNNGNRATCYMGGDVEISTEIIGNIHDKEGV